VRNQKYEGGGRSKLKFTFCIMETTDGPLHLHEGWYSKTQTRLFLLLLFYVGRRYEIFGLLKTNAEQLCVEFCNTVQCLGIFINYLTC
jgi:hypothetical protein